MLKTDQNRLTLTVVIQFILSVSIIAFTVVASCRVFADGILGTSSCITAFVYICEKINHGQT